MAQSPTSTSSGLCPSCGVAVKVSPTQLFVQCPGCGKRLGRTNGDDPWGVRREAPAGRGQLTEPQVEASQPLAAAPAPARPKEPAADREKRVQRFELIADTNSHAKALNLIASIFAVLGIFGAVGTMLTDSKLVVVAVSSLLSGAMFWAVFRALSLLLRYTAARL